jgi:thiamine biosynthesis lipoprotein
VSRRLPGLILVCAATAAACTRAAAPAAIRIGGPTMGTTWSVTLVPGPAGVSAAEIDTVHRAVSAYLDRIDDLMSTWNADSELSRLNRSASLEPVPVAPETFEVLEWAARVTRETGGAFDVTVGPLVDAWGFGPDDDVPVPTPGMLDALRAHTGMEQLGLDPERRSVRKGHAEVRADVSALAPGYAADGVAALLGERGFEDVLVDVGGELVARGHNEHGRRWRVAVELPGGSSREMARLVEITDAGMATSGDYRNYREVDGQRLAHIIDPRTGHPIAHRLASATVVDALAVRADALATALMVLGAEDGLALAERLDVAALLIVRREGDGFDTRASSRFEALVARD